MRRMRFRRRCRGGGRARSLARPVGPARVRGGRRPCRSTGDAVRPRLGEPGPAGAARRRRVRPEVIVSDVDESTSTPRRGRSLSGTLARLKAEAVAGRLTGPGAGARLRLGARVRRRDPGQAASTPTTPPRRWRRMRGRHGRAAHRSLPHRRRAPASRPRRPRPPPSTSPTSPTPRSTPTWPPANRCRSPARSRSTAGAARSSPGSRATTAPSSACRCPCSGPARRPRTSASPTCGQRVAHVPQNARRSTEDLNAYVAAHDPHTDEVAARADRGDARRCSPTTPGCRSPRAGRAADDAHPAGRCEGRGRGGHVHRLLGAVDRAGSGRRRQADLLRHLRPSTPTSPGSYWERAGVADRIELRIGPAQERLAELPPDPVVDIAFIDADKSSYPKYWDELVPRMRPGGLLVIDNVLAAAGCSTRATDDHVIVDFNDMVRDDDRGSTRSCCPSPTASRSPAALTARRRRRAPHQAAHHHGAPRRAGGRPGGTPGGCRPGRRSTQGERRQPEPDRHRVRAARGGQVGLAAAVVHGQRDRQRVVQRVAEPAHQQAGDRQPRRGGQPEDGEPGRAHRQRARAAPATAGTAAQPDADQPAEEHPADDRRDRGGRHRRGETSAWPRSSSPAHRFRQTSTEPVTTMLVQASQYAGEAGRPGERTRPRRPRADASPENQPTSATAATAGTTAARPGRQPKPSDDRAADDQRADDADAGGDRVGLADRGRAGRAVMARQRGDDAVDQQRPGDVEATKRRPSSPGTAAPPTAPRTPTAIPAMPAQMTCGRPNRRTRQGTPPRRPGADRERRPVQARRPRGWCPARRAAGAPPGRTRR